MGEAIARCDLDTHAPIYLLFYQNDRVDLMTRADLEAKVRLVLS